MSKALLQCDFCNRDQRNVPIMVAGPFGADICSECVELCVEVIAERRAERGTASEGPGKP
jgi:ATP-dependent Clp protease ATP-binding subunit ClpX